MLVSLPLIALSFFTPWEFQNTLFLFITKESPFNVENDAQKNKKFSLNHYVCIWGLQKKKMTNNRIRGNKIKNS